MAGAERKVAIVTGGGAGIGLGIASALAEAGYDLALLDVNEGTAKEAAAKFARGAGRVLPLQCDVSKKADVGSAVAIAVAELGVPNLLVNNAGISRAARLEDLGLDEWNAVLGVNLTGVLLCTQAVGRHMLAAGRGSIVNVASQAGSIPAVFRASYCASKAGVILLTKTTALEWGPRGVRCNCISPGMVWTSISGPIYGVPELLEERRRAVPIKRLADPKEIGAAVVFLASAAASYVNGVDLPVDAGLRLTTLNHLPAIGPDGDVVRPELISYPGAAQAGSSGS